MGVFADGATSPPSRRSAPPVSAEGGRRSTSLDIVDASLARSPTTRTESLGSALLETVRAFAVSELEATDPEGLTRDRHAHHYSRCP